MLPTKRIAHLSTAGDYCADLADLYRQTGRDAEGESVLRAAIATSARDVGLHHALGLTLTRLKQYREGPPALRQ